MRLWHLFLLISVFLWTAFPNVLLADPDRLTSKEWLAMTENHRSEYVAIAASQLQSRGVSLSKTPSEYLRAINDWYARKPDMPATAVSELLPTIVYKTEPASRKPLDKLIKKHDVEIVRGFD